MKFLVAYSQTQMSPQLPSRSDTTRLSTIWKSLRTWTRQETKHRVLLRNSDAPKVL